ncbi:MAG: phosphoribosylformylglycinamidine synthase subunit PurL [Candidatus Omnitrophica bacterium]|nr:phosphoribosylformylglycinamidine synthase subunit PurL [Candidatus Omnitrophota bacterium]
MIWRIDIYNKKKSSCPKIVSQVKDLGISKSFEVFQHLAYYLDCGLSKDDIEIIASKLLVDPIVQDYRISQRFFESRPSENQIIITYNPGVCDPIALSLKNAIKELNLTIQQGRTARVYEFAGLTFDEINNIAPRVLFNPLIEHILDYEKVKDVVTLDEFSGRDYKFELVNVDILNASDTELVRISEQGCLSLSLDEMKVIRDYFKDLKRNPTDCELETIATLWSEHCGHKTFRGHITYKEKDTKGNVLKTEEITNLLKTTVMRATNEIAHKDCVSVFHDNSGIVKFDDKNNICFKVETHNHPSSLEPYGGASTGIGGVIRDILGTGGVAKPFASVDVFCFSPWNISYDDLPHGLLHPRRVIKGVTRGVRDYGNRMGIPTVAGAVLFDDRFLGNPLVYCGTLGIMPKEKSFKDPKVGDLVFVCGAKTGRDGIHGATFSSKELDEQTVALTSAVQIGNPIEEKKVMEALLRARDKDLINAITDCGAGGLSSAATELGEEHGIEVDLDKVPLKYRGLNYTEIWISESQERMVFFSSKEQVSELKEIFDEEDVELTAIGKVTGNKKLILNFNGNKVCDLDMDFIFRMPVSDKKAIWVDKDKVNPEFIELNDYSSAVTDILARPNIACKDWVVREYDHEVQAGSVIKPMQGISKIAIADASVVRPDLKSEKAVVIGMGINPYYSDVDPYWMAAASIEESLRNVVASGGRMDKTYILDNFCWGSPQDEEVLGTLVRAAKACYDFSVYYGVPFISGKDSLYNEYMVKGKHISIPGTLLISAMSVVDSWAKTMTADFKSAGDLVYVIGITKKELGSSEYYRMLQIIGADVPKVDIKTSKNILLKTSELIDKGIINACHDVSDGGLASALAEMSIGGDMGANIDLNNLAFEQGMCDGEKLFSESQSRFVVTVNPENCKKLERVINGIDFSCIGETTKDKRLNIKGSAGKIIVELDAAEMRSAWMKTFDNFR